MSITFFRKKITASPFQDLLLNKDPALKLRSRMMSSDKNGSNTFHQNGQQLPHIFSLDSDATLKEPISTKVEGKIPKWLKGSLYRNGCGLYKIGDTVWKHMFDGFAVLHRWTIKDGRVTYLSTVLDSDHYKRCVAANRIMGSGFGSKFPDPCKSIFRRFFSHFLPLPPDPTDNTAVNIVEMGDRLFALTETTLINEVDPKTMLKTGKINLSEHLALHIGTAHPHFEKDGTVLYYGTNMNYKKAYNIVQAIPPASNEAPLVNGKIIASIPSRWKMNIGYNHSFGMSENYVIVLELPFAINIMKVLTMEMRGESLVDGMETYPDEKILIHVVEKKTGKHHPITYKAPHGFVFHFINCYEEANHLIVDVCLSDAAEVKTLYLETLINDTSTKNKANFARFVLPLNIKGAQVGDNVNHLPGSQAKAVMFSNTVVEVAAEKLFGTKIIFDLPRINYESVNGLKYRYAYGSTIFTPDEHKKVVKLDIMNKTVKEWKSEKDYEPAEPIFIAHPDATKEDDGVILCPVVSTSAENKSFLLVLDASTFEEIATASIPPEVKMNLTFHGTFTSKVF